MKDRWGTAVARIGITVLILVVAVPVLYILGSIIFFGAGTQGG